MQLPSSLKGEYERLTSERSPYLQTARDCAKYTVPTLVPQTGRTNGRRLRSGYSNFGARCVNSLSSKLLLAILPARQSFFRFEVEEETLKRLGGERVRSDIDAALSTMEGIIQTDIETTPTRTPAGEAVKHLLVAGNVLIYMMPTGGLKVYPLHSYVCLRDDSGNVLRIVAEDRVSPLTLPKEIRAAVVEKIAARNSTEKTVTVYTGVFRSGDVWRVFQEVEGVRVPGSQGTYPLDASPWLSLRWTPVAGESYGRSLVEDYLGYFTSLEALTAALVKGTAVAAKVIYLRNPNGVTKAAALTRSETGDVVDGKIDDVHALQSEKAQDFRTCREMINDLKEELSYAFALNQAIQRNAERVTAEEIRYMAQELDALLGGNYSTLSLEFQRPYLQRKVLELQRSGRLPMLPRGTLRPVIVTGLDALGRGAELDSLRALVKDVVDMGGPEALQRFIDFGDLLKRLSTARGIKTEGLIKPQADILNEDQQRQFMALVQQLGPNAITQLGQLAKEQMAQSSQQQPQPQ